MAGLDLKIDYNPVYLISMKVLEVIAPKKAEELKRIAKEERNLNKWVSGFLSRMSPEPNSPCIRWVGCINPKNHYGHCRVPVRFASRWVISATITTGAHRMSYTLFRGPIPKGFHIDHLCDHRWCVNAYHLEAVPPAINAYRANGVKWDYDYDSPEVL